ncbi:MAG: hypothetical protein JW749_00025 [Sedimentisphaerales bacterium]|nr:hypothetical protein [Sedimentisphaerales bacterium]
MAFQFYSNLISQASRRLAGGLLTTGLGLIGFGLLILLLPAFFVMLAAIFFFVVGIGTCVTAFKIFLAQRRIDKTMSDGSDEYRKNVRIRIEQ